MDTGVDYIYMTELQNRIANDYEYTHSFTQHIKHAIVNIGISEGYFQKANYAEPKLQLFSSANAFLFFGLLLFTLVNFVCYMTRMDLAFGSFFILGGSFIIRALYQKALAKKYILLTQYGENEYQKWRGLYNFLKSDTLIHERTMIELPLWEKYLVYATAFGISQKVIDAIQIHCPQTTTDSIVNNNYCRSGRIRTSGRSIHSSIRSSSYSGGSGGGFGYGGGGRGGGGGGGGH